MLILSILIIASCSYVNHKRAIEFYDQHVKNFPEEKQMNNIITIPEEKKLPLPNDSIKLKDILLKHLGTFSKMLILILIYSTPAVVAGEAARKRGYEKTWFLFIIFSLAFTPVLGFLAVIAFPTKVNYIKVIK
jgi:hypothetical protein